MHCPSCGQDNPAGNSFCTFCGSPLRVGSPEEERKGGWKGLPFYTRGTIAGLLVFALIFTGLNILFMVGSGVEVIEDAVQGIVFYALFMIPTFVVVVLAWRTPTLTPVAGIWAILMLLITAPSIPNALRTFNSFFDTGLLIPAIVSLMVAGVAGIVGFLQQCVCPSGASLQAMATRCASCLPSNLRLCPGRGRSMSALSSPSCTNCVRTRPTVEALINSPLAMSRSIRPSSAFSNTSARLTLRAEVSPRLAICLRCVRSDSFNSTLYLRAGMSSYVLLIGSYTRLTYFLYLSHTHGTGTSLESVSPDEKAAAISVDMENSAFKPAQLTVPAGKPAKFVIKNRDLTVHTFTIKELGIDVKVLSGSEELIELSSPPAGTYVYSCTSGIGFSLPLHKPEVESEPSIPSDSGTLVVSES